MSWRFVRRLLWALGKRLRRWGDALIAALGEPRGNDVQATLQHEVTRVDAQPGMAEAAAYPGRAAARQSGQAPPTRLVRTERGSVPKRAGAPAAAPGRVLPPQAVPGRFTPQPRSARSLPSAPSALPPEAPGPYGGAPPGWPARPGLGGPPHDWLARVERSAPQDWIARVARQSAPAPHSARPGRRMARALASVLPHVRSMLASARVMPQRTTVGERPGLAPEPVRAAARALPTERKLPDAGPAALADPQAWPGLGSGKRDRLAPRWPAAPEAGEPGTPTAPGMFAPLRGAAPPHWQESAPAPASCADAAQRPLTGLWPALPPPGFEPGGMGAAAALREHDRLRRIEVEQRGIGWNAWLS